MVKVVKKQQKEQKPGWKRYIIEAAILIPLFMLSVFVHTIWWPRVTSKTDAERFAAEYTQVEAENPFVYRDAAEVIQIFEHGTGVVFLGFPECPWCQAYVGYLAEVARDYGVEKIYYHNILEGRKNNTTEYQKMVEILDENLQYDEEGQRRIYVPNVTLVIDGEIVANDFETSKDTLGLEDPAEYWTEERVAALKTRLADWMKRLAEAKGCVTTCNE